MPHLTLNARRQHGVVLITSLLILLVMTLIGVTAMQTNIQQEQMAGNMNDRNMAFQAAETALRFAEEYLETEKENGQEYIDSLFNLHSARAQRRFRIFVIAGMQSISLLS